MMFFSQKEPPQDTYLEFVPVLDPLITSPSIQYAGWGEVDTLLRLPQNVIFEYEFDVEFIYSNKDTKDTKQSRPQKMNA